MGYAKIFVATYAFRGGTNLHVHTLSLNLHTGLGTKKVLKTELGTYSKKVVYRHDLRSASQTKDFVP